MNFLKFLRSAVLGVAVLFWFTRLYIHVEYDIALLVYVL